MNEKFYDVVVIGAGSGGLTAAVGFSKIGKKVLLVEREHMGGECTNTGCVPSKALLHAAKQFHSAEAVGELGTLGETYRNEAFAYVRKTIDGFLEHETPETFEKLGIDVVMGEAAFHTPCSVKVKVNAESREDALGHDETEYHYKHAIIATGSRPRMIEIPGLRETDLLTNQNIFDLETIPERTLIVGAGPIGLEMGQALAMLGSQVTIAAIDSEFARLEDEAIRPILKRKFDELGVTVHLNAFINRVENGFAIFDLKKDGEIVGEERVPFDKLLLAIGRTPNFPPGLDAAGIKFDERCVLVDSQYRTSNKYVYALGDVSQKLKFTHTADDTARQVVTRIASKGFLRINSKKSVPKVTYTSPEIAQVGLSWEEAKRKYAKAQLMRIEVPFLQNDRAVTDDATEGVLVVIARRLNGAVLGAHIIGPRAGELISTFTLAIDEKVSLWKLQRLIFAYPTYSLIIKKGGDVFVGRQLADLKHDVAGLLKRAAPKIIAALLWTGAVLWLHTYQTTHELSSTDTAIRLFDFITMTAWGPLVYILLYTIRPITFFPATALTILAGIFFGFLWGTVLTVVAATLSASVAYGVGRFFGENLRLEDTAIGRWVTTLREHTFSAVLTTRLIFLPFDLVSYAAGILRTAFAPFVLATFIGIILGTATFVSVGASLNLEEFKTTGFTLDLFEPQFLLLSAVIFAISIGLSKVLKRWKAEM